MENNKVPELQKRLQEADKKVIESLKQFFKDDEIKLIVKQLNVLYDIIARTELRYQYSKDYREALDIIIGLIIGGKFIDTVPSNLNQNPFNNNLSSNNNTNNTSQVNNNSSININNS